MYALYAGVLARRFSVAVSVFRNAHQELNWCFSRGEATNKHVVTVISVGINSTGHLYHTL